MTFFNLAHRRPIETSLLFGCLLFTTACPPPAQTDESTSSTSDETTTDSTSTTDTGNEPQIICDPGETRCADSATLETCAVTGLEWEPSSCETEIGETCEPCFGADPMENNCVAACIGPCDRAVGTPSSEGCSFFTTSIYQAEQDMPYADAIVVGNPSSEFTATVTLTFTPFGSNIEEIIDTQEIPPQGSYDFVLPDDLTEYFLQTSVFRSGLVHHVTSNIPVVAYLHAPYQATLTNGSALLLPEHVMTGNYVVYGHKPLTRPSYFVVIALQDQTTVRWYPTKNTAGDSLPLPPVTAGEEGEQLMNRLDNMRILTSLSNGAVCNEDFSGTVIEADKPIWVLSATRGARIPFCHQSEVLGCTDDGVGYVDAACFAGSDLLMEQNLPLEFWGREYVGPASPPRGNEDHVWRIFAGEDDMTVDVYYDANKPPAAPDAQIQFAKRGQPEELIVPHATNLYFSSDKPFMPVQYVTGDYVASGAGSPAMTQMVPTAQFLDNYVFVPGKGYDPHNFVQFIREAGGDDIRLDGVLQDQLSWSPVGDFEVATLSITEAAHAVDSDGNFGIIQYGWTVKPEVLHTAGYAYPGGMKAEVIYVP